MSSSNSGDAQFLEDLQEAVSATKACLALTKTRMQSLEQLFIYLVDERTCLAPLPEENLLKLLLWNLSLEALEIIKCFSMSKEVAGDDSTLIQLREAMLAKHEEDSTYSGDLVKDTNSKEQSEDMQTLMVCHANVKKYFILNDFLLSKINETSPEKLRGDLLAIIKGYEKMVDRISDFSFVVQELNVNNFEAYAQQLVILMLTLFK